VFKHQGRRLQSLSIEAKSVPVSAITGVVENTEKGCLTVYEMDFMEK
jgi:hypothetical protein